MVEERTSWPAPPAVQQQQRESSSSSGSGGGSSATANTAASDSFFERTNHAVLVVGWGVEASTGKKYWWAQNTWGDGWGESGYFRMARGNDDSAFESMAVAVDVDGALPLPISKRLSAAEALEADGDERGSHEAVKAEMRRSAALRRRANRSPFSGSSSGANTLTPEDHPPPSPSPRYATVEEPREHGMATSLWGSHDTFLDAIAHWGYGGGVERREIGSSPLVASYSLSLSDLDYVCTSKLSIKTEAHTCSLQPDFIRAMCARSSLVKLASSLLTTPWTIFAIAGFGKPRCVSAFRQLNTKPPDERIS